MLREVKNKHVKPRIVPFQSTVDTSANTIALGIGDIVGTRTGTGAGTLTLRHPFSRNGLLVASLDTGSNVGGYVALGASTGSKSDFPFINFGPSGSASNSYVTCGALFGWDSSDLSICKTQRVAAVNSSPRIIWGRITAATGAVAIGLGDFTCTRTATGSFTIRYKKSFGALPSIFTTTIGTSVASASVLSKTAEQVILRVADSSTIPTDVDFYICVIGSDSRSDSGRGRMPLQNSQRLPRIIAGQITNTAGTPTISIGGVTGGADFTGLVDNGAGDFSVNFAEAFKREPAIFVTTYNQRAMVHSASASTMRLLTKDASGTNTDVTGITNFFVIGSDDATQF